MQWFHEYIAWLGPLLYNKDFHPSGEKIDYDIKIFDDICQLRDTIIEKNSQSDRPSRMLSGDVFDWKSRDNKNEIDINIDDFHAQWNMTKSFATDPKSINEVGCIHTSQGMEFEYVGLIVGEDIVFRNGMIQTDYTKNPESGRIQKTL